MIWSIKKLDNSLLIAVVIFSFIAGRLYGFNFILSIFCLIFVIYLSILRERFQSNIKGYGIKNITVGDKKPSHPEKGDLWIDTR